MFAVACLSSVTYAQTREVSGRVLSNDGTPIVGASVSVVGATAATQTDVTGNFKIYAAPGSTLSISYVGFNSQRVSIANSTVLNVILNPDDNTLDEVVVVAYGTQTKESITGAVASISSKDIEKRPVSSVTAVLEGISPGLQVNNSYGEPGSSPNIRIRGFGSINGSSAPVYVLDGVIFSGNISDINPNDIESVTVLKDATSAALYGSRAANGVIVITSKKGRVGAADLNVVANWGSFSRGIPEYDMLSPEAFMEASWAGYRNQLATANPTWSAQRASEEATSGLIPSILKLNIFDMEPNQLFDANGKLNPNAKIKGDYAGDLDWFDPISRTGLRQDYTINGRGGSEKSNFYFSTNYLSEEGYLTTSNFDRLSGRVSGEITPKSWVKAGMSINASHQLSDFMTSTGTTTIVNPWYFARTIAPIYPIHAHDPATGRFLLDAEGNKIYDNGEISRNQLIGRHVIWEQELNEDKTKRNTMNSQAYLNFNFLENFTFSVLGDINLRYNEERSYDNAIIGDGSGNKGRANRDIYNYKNYSAQQILNYTKTFNTDHNIDLMVGHENYGNIYTYLAGSKNTETFAGENHLINFSNIVSFTDYEYNDKSESFFGRARYNYDEKYYVEGSLRRDGTSRVAKENRWANFWSLGGTWIASKETFLQDVDWLNNLKLRAATGVVGSLGSLGFNDYLSLFALGQNNNLSALYKSNIGNTNLKWEGSKSSSIAVEGRLFNRVNFVVEYFDKRSQDLLFNVNLPLSVGSTNSGAGSATVTRNIGDLVNKGFEFTFDADIVKSEDFSWNLGFNATILKNKIINLPQENKENGLISSPFKYMEGRSVYDYFLRQYAGVDMMTGQSLYYADTEAYDPTSTTEAWYPFQEEVNGVMYTRNSSYAKQEFSGSAIPNLMGAVNTNLNYRNWSLSGLFTYSIGGKGLDYSYINLMSMSASPSSAHADLTQSWKAAPAGMTDTSPNRINPDMIPQIHFNNSQYNNANSTRFLMNSSYLTIRNIALGYRLPANISQRAGFSRVSFILTGENLATFTSLKGYSPQQSFGGTSQSQFVPSRTISFGLNIGF